MTKNVATNNGQASRPKKKKKSKTQYIDDPVENMFNDDSQKSDKSLEIYEEKQQFAEQQGDEAQYEDDEIFQEAAELSGRIELIQSSEDEASGPAELVTRRQKRPRNKNQPIKKSEEIVDGHTVISKRSYNIVGIDFTSFSNLKCAANSALGLGALVPLKKHADDYTARTLNFWQQLKGVLGSGFRKFPFDVDFTCEDKEIILEKGETNLYVELKDNAKYRQKERIQHLDSACSRTVLDQLNPIGKDPKYWNENEIFDTKIFPKMHPNLSLVFRKFIYVRDRQGIVFKHKALANATKLLRKYIELNEKTIDGINDSNFTDWEKNDKEAATQEQLKRKEKIRKDIIAQKTNINILEKWLETLFYEKIDEEENIVDPVSEKKVKVLDILLILIKDFMVLAYAIDDQQPYILSVCYDQNITVVNSGFDERTGGDYPLIVNTRVDGNKKTTLDQLKKGYRPKSYYHLFKGRVRSLRFDTDNEHCNVMVRRRIKGTKRVHQQLEPEEPYDEDQNYDEEKHKELFIKLPQKTYDTEGRLVHTDESLRSMDELYLIQDHAFEKNYKPYYFSYGYKNGKQYIDAYYTTSSNVFYHPQLPIFDIEEFYKKHDPSVGHTSCKAIRDVFQAILQVQLINEYLTRTKSRTLKIFIAGGSNKQLWERFTFSSAVDLLLHHGIIDNVEVVACRIENTGKHYTEQKQVLSHNAGDDINIRYIDTSDELAQSEEIIAVDIFINRQNGEEGLNADIAEVISSRKGLQIECNKELRCSVAMNDAMTAFDVMYYKLIRSFFTQLLSTRFKVDYEPQIAEFHQSIEDQPMTGTYDVNVDGLRTENTDAHEGLIQISLMPNTNELRFLQTFRALEQNVEEYYCNNDMNNTGGKYTYQGRYSHEAIQHMKEMKQQWTKFTCEETRARILSNLDTKDRHRFRDDNVHIAVEQTKQKLFNPYYSDHGTCILDKRFNLHPKDEQSERTVEIRYSGGFMVNAQLTGDDSGLTQESGLTLDQEWDRIMRFSDLTAKQVGQIFTNEKIEGLDGSAISKKKALTKILTSKQYNEVSSTCVKIIVRNLLNELLVPRENHSAPLTILGQDPIIDTNNIQSYWANKEKYKHDNMNCFAQFVARMKSCFKNTEGTLLRGSVVFDHEGYDLHEVERRLRTHKSMTSTFELLPNQKKECKGVTVYGRGTCPSVIQNNYDLTHETKISFEKRNGIIVDITGSLEKMEIEESSWYERFIKDPTLIHSSFSFKNFTTMSDITKDAILANEYADAYISSIPIYTLNYKKCVLAEEVKRVQRKETNASVLSISDLEALRVQMSQLSNEQRTFLNLVRNLAKFLEKREAKTDDVLAYNKEMGFNQVLQIPIVPQIKEYCKKKNNYSGTFIIAKMEEGLKEDLKIDNVTLNDLQQDVKDHTTYTRKFNEEFYDYTSDNDLYLLLEGLSYGFSLLTSVINQNQNDLPQEHRSKLLYTDRYLEKYYQGRLDKRHIKDKNAITLLDKHITTMQVGIFKIMHNRMTRLCSAYAAIGHKVNLTYMNLQNIYKRYNMCEAVELFNDVYDSFRLLQIKNKDKIYNTILGDTEIRLNEMYKYMNLLCCLKPKEFSGGMKVLGQKNVENTKLTKLNKVAAEWIKFKMDLGKQVEDQRNTGIDINLSEYSSTLDNGSIITESDVNDTPDNSSDFKTVDFGDDSTITIPLGVLTKEGKTEEKIEESKNKQRKQKDAVSRKAKSDKQPMPIKISPAMTESESLQTDYEAQNESIALEDWVAKEMQKKKEASKTNGNIQSRLYKGKLGKKSKLVNGLCPYAMKNIPYKDRNALGCVEGRVMKDQILEDPREKFDEEQKKHGIYTNKVQSVPNKLSKDGFISTLNAPAYFITRAHYDHLNEKLKTKKLPLIKIIDANPQELESKFLHWKDTSAMTRQMKKMSRKQKKNECVRISMEDYEKYIDEYAISKNYPKNEHVVNASLVQGGLKKVNCTTKEISQGQMYRQACAGLDSDNQFVDEAYTTFYDGVIDKLTENELAEIIGKFSIKNYISKFKESRPEKANQLRRQWKIIPVYSKYLTKENMRMFSKIFQKNPNQEIATDGKDPKPRVICPALVEFKGELSDVLYGLKKHKKLLENYYNLFCAYLSDLMIACIKEVTVKRECNSTFVHGVNHTQLVKMISDKIGRFCEEENVTQNDLTNICIDYAKFDATRHKNTLERFDNKMIKAWIEKFNDKQINTHSDFDKTIIDTSTSLLTQTNIDVYHYDANNDLNYMSKLYGTVVSGFAGRTTLGNTSYNLAMAMMYTKGCKALHFAAGDDCFMVVKKKDVDYIVKRMKRMVAKKNPKTTGPNQRTIIGSGCIIEDDFRIDGTIITFQSKVIDLEYNSCVRQIENYYATSLVSDSTTAREVQNYNNIAQLEDYFKIAQYKSIKPFWMSQDVKDELLPKHQKRDLHFRAEYDKNVHLSGGPMNYIGRALKVTGGYQITLNGGEIDRKQIRHYNINRICNDQGAGKWN